MIPADNLLIDTKPAFQDRYQEYISSIRLILKICPINLPEAKRRIRPPKNFNINKKLPTVFVDFLIQIKITAQLISFL